MKLITYSTILAFAFLGEVSHGIELKNLAGKFRLQSSRANDILVDNKEIEIIYLPGFRFDGSNENFEVLKFGDAFLIIKDSQGRSQLSEAKLDAKNPDLTSSLDAKESQDAISSQPNSYTRMFFKVNDQNNFVLSFTYKVGAFPIGPHIDLFSKWQKTPNHVVTIKRIP